MAEWLHEEDKGLVAEWIYGCINALLRTSPHRKCDIKI
jgi:hypothetical protein